jgi:PAS domain S-box-containing protein
MHANQKAKLFNLELRLVVTAVVLFAIVILGIAWISIKKSRTDSFNLLVQQGTAFTNALADGAAGAIAAESYYDRFITRNYSDLILVLMNNKQINVQTMSDFVDRYDFLAVYIFNLDSTCRLGCSAHGEIISPPPIIDSSVRELIADEDNEFSNIMYKDDVTGEDIQLYFEKVHNPPCVVVLKNNAHLYNSALRETGIGYLAQRMSRSQGVEYIFYQTTDGIIFASRETGQLLAIESDPFLSKTLTGDTICTRIITFFNKPVLELAKPFSTKQYHHGLFRVGVSLEGYYKVSHSFDFQMIVFSSTLFVLMSMALLYFGSRRKRQELSREFTRVKSIADRVFEHMKVGVAVVDERGNVIFTNVAFQAIFSSPNIEGKSLEALIPQIASIVGEIAGNIKGAKEKEISITVDDRKKSLLVACSTVTYDDQPGTASIIIVHDISELKQFEREASRRERLSEMGHLAAGVAHEIRNPLNTISIAIQRLATEFSPSENVEEYLEFTSKIHTETKRLNDIITRFLSLARENHPVSNTVRLDEIVNDFYSFVKPENDQLGIDMSISVIPETRINARPEEIKQVLVNLFNNSKEAFRGNPGEITISTEIIAPNVILKYSDHGPGIPKEIRSQVFAPYFTTKDSGTGLGLPTVFKIISEIGGDIRIDDSADRGVTFIISIPLAH